MRLQKYLALCGVASRRAAEKLIAEGNVTVNGAVVTEMGVSVADTIFQPIPSRRARAQRSNASASGEYPFVARHSKAKSERNGQCSESLACMAVTTFFPL